MKHTFKRTLIGNKIPNCRLGYDLPSPKHLLVVEGGATDDVDPHQKRTFGPEDVDVPGQGVTAGAADAAGADPRGAAHAFIKELCS